MQQRWRRRTVARLVVACALGGCWLALTVPVQAQEDPPPAPKLLLVGPTELAVELDRVPAMPGQWDGETKIVLANDGTAPAAVAVTAIVHGGDRDCQDDDVQLATPDLPESLEAGSSVPVIVELTAATGCTGISGTLLLEADGASPVAATFVLGREAESVNYWRPFWGALVVAAVVALSLVMARRGSLNDVVPAGPSWSFKDSWLTNLAALGAVLGTVFAATGFVAEVLPGVATERLVGLNLVFGTMVLAAPLVYAATSKWEYVEVASKSGETSRVLQSSGRTWGLFLSGAVTIWGVVGQLMTLLELNAASDADLFARVVVGALIIAGIGVVLVYALRWTYGVTTPDTARAAASVPAVADREASGTL